MRYRDGVERMCETVRFGQLTPPHGMEQRLQRAETWSGPVAPGTGSLPASRGDPGAPLRRLEVATPQPLRWPPSRVKRRQPALEDRGGGPTGSERQMEDEAGAIAPPKLPMGAADLQPRIPRVDDRRFPGCAPCCYFRCCLSPGASSAYGVPVTKPGCRRRSDGGTTRDDGGGCPLSGGADLQVQAALVRRGPRSNYSSKPPLRLAETSRQ